MLFSQGDEPVSRIICFIKSIGEEEEFQCVMANQE